MSQSPSLGTLQTQINTLTARLAALDGQGLANPNTSFVAQTNAKLTGLQEDLTQSVLTLEGILQKVNGTVLSLWTAVATALGITPPPAPDSVTVCPPNVVPPS